MALASNISAPSATVTPSLSVTPPKDSIVVPDDYSSINDAINNAPEGGTVFVRRGSYSARVYVRKSLLLIGEDPENTVISVSGLGPIGTYAAIEVSASDVTVSGFTIKNSPKGIWITKEHYQLPEPSRCKIIGNNLIDNFGTGLSMAAGENHVVSGNNITGNRAEGIYASSSNSVISGNNITGNGVAGMIVDSCSNVTIRGNSITGNGVDIDTSSERRGGIRLRWDGPFYVHGNNITDNQGHGIEFAEGCDNSRVYKNNIARNSIGVNLLNFGLGGSGIGLGNVVYRNNIVDNSQQAFVDLEYDFAELYPERSNGTDVVSWDNGKEGNYWSDCQTRYPNAAEVGTSGIGDTPYVIDENNTDHHPLMQAINFYAPPPPPPTPPPTTPPFSEPPSDSSSTSSSDSLPIIAAIVAAVVVVILAIVVLVHRMRKKGSPPAPLHPQP